MTIKKYIDPVFVEPGKQEIDTVNQQAYKILFVGNSITRHGVYREIGWEYEAGMAASAEKNDYAHRTVALIQEQMPERKVEFYYGNVNLLIKSSEPARNLPELFGEKMPKPDLVIIQTGEHEGPDKSAAEIETLYEKKSSVPWQNCRFPCSLSGYGIPQTINHIPTG